jgi:hypothetical protein
VTLIASALFAAISLHISCSLTPTVGDLRDGLAAHYGYECEAMSNTDGPWFRTDVDRMYGIVIYGKDASPARALAWSMQDSESLIEQATRLGVALGGTPEAVIEAMGSVATKAQPWEGDELEQSFPFGEGTLVVEWSRLAGLHVEFTQ